MQTLVSSILTHWSSEGKLNLCSSPTIRTIVTTGNKTYMNTVERILKLQLLCPASDLDVIYRLITRCDVFRQCGLWTLPVCCISDPACNPRRSHDFSESWDWLHAINLVPALCVCTWHSWNPVHKSQHKTHFLCFVLYRQHFSRVLFLCFAAMTVYDWWRFVSYTWLCVGSKGHGTPDWDRDSTEVMSDEH